MLNVNDSNKAINNHKSTFEIVQCTPIVCTVLCVHSILIIFSSHAPWTVYVAP